MADFNPDQFLAETAPKAGPQPGFNPDQFLAETSPNNSELGVIGTTAKAIDSVTGAPTRAAIYAAQNGKNPISAGWKQFANMTDEAPSGKDIAAKAGASTKTSPTYGGKGGRAPVDLSTADILGEGVDLAANPLNLAGPALKMAGKIGEAATPVSESLNEFATDRALKAAGAMKKDFNIIHAKGTQDALGNFLLDKKLVTPLSTVSKIADRISSAKEAAGETIGEILDSAQTSKAPPISAKDIALKLSEDPEIKQLATIPGKEGTANQINKFIETLYNHPSGDSLSLREAQSLRQGIDDSINFNKSIPEMRGSQPYLFKMRDAVSNAMNDSVNAMDGGGEVNRLKTANAAYSKLATLDKIAQNRLGALSSNEQFSLGDKVAAGVGAVAGHGNPIIAVTVGAANKAARSIGNSVAATGANAASKMISGVPETLSNIPTLAGPGTSALVNGASQTLPRAAALPSKGPDKWASDGLQKLQKVDASLSDPTISNSLLQSSTVKNLLIKASSLSPNSPAFNKIMTQIKSSDDYSKAVQQKKASDEAKRQAMITYPRKVTKGDLTAIVSNNQEHKEALSEGWQ